MCIRDRIQGEEIFQIDAILNQEWLIQTQAGPDIGDFCFGGSGTGNHLGRVPRSDVQARKDNKAHTEQQQNYHCKSFGNIAFQIKFSSRARIENLSSYEI